MFAADKELDLLYDPILDCYYDPKTNRYYELKWFHLGGTCETILMNSASKFPSPTTTACDMNKAYMFTFDEWFYIIHMIKKVYNYYLATNMEGILTF